MGVKRRYTKRQSRKKTTIVLGPSLCELCDLHSDEPYLGQLLYESNISVHENCLFFSPVLNQEFDPSVQKCGYILGFKISEIEKEIKRINRLRCSICKDKKGGVGCCMPTCRKSFHLHCGLKNNAVGIFNDCFQFYCNEHAKHQDLKKQISLCNKTVPECTICLELALVEGDGEHDCSKNIDSWDAFLKETKNRTVLHGMCCTRSWMHRSCMARYGLSAGLHHVKCPNCSNTSLFVDTVQQCGIWLPDRDASWELEPGAFQDMYEDIPEDNQSNQDDPEPSVNTVPALTENIENVEPSLTSPSQSSRVRIQTDIRRYLISSSNVTPVTLDRNSPDPLSESRKRLSQQDIGLQTHPIVQAKRRRKSKDNYHDGAGSLLVRRQSLRCTPKVTYFTHRAVHARPASQAKL